MSDLPDEVFDRVIPDFEYAAGDTKGMSVFKDRCHHVVDVPKIWQFSSGSYRVGFFYDAGHRIVIAHCYPMHSGSKFSPRDRKTLCERHRTYTRAKANGTLVID